MVNYYKACVAGTYNENRGLPCQECSYSKRKGDFMIAGVGSGFSNPDYKFTASETAVHTAVDLIFERVNEDMNEEELKDLMVIALAFAANALYAIKFGFCLKEYDTSISLCLYDGKNLYYSHAGDSGIIVLLKNGTYKQVTSQQRDEQGQAITLCAGLGTGHCWAFGKVSDPVSSVMLMTRSVFSCICPPIFELFEDNDREKTDICLARNFLENNRCSSEEMPLLEQAAVKCIRKLHWYDSYEDICFMVLINDESRPAEREPSYYMVPSWSESPQQAGWNIDEI